MNSQAVRQLLAGKLRLHATFPALHGMLAAHMSTEPKIANHHFGLCAAIGNHPDNFKSDRVWWKVEHPDFDGCSYISLRPGEFRITKPSDGLVLKTPPIRVDGLTAALETLIKDVRVDPSGRPRQVRDLLEQAEHICHEIRSSKPPFQQSFDKFFALGEQVRTGKSRNSELNDALSSLYHELVANFRMPVNQFAAADLLLRLQASANQWIAVDKRLAPPGFHPYREAISCISTLVAGFPSHLAPQMLEYLRQTVSATYTLGREAVSEALNSDTLVGYQKTLVTAIYYLNTSIIAARVVEKRKGVLPAGCTLLAIEEAYVCAHAGLFVGVTFFNSDPDMFAREICEGRFGGSQDKRLLRFHFTSEIWPIFPKIFVRMIVARAKAMSPGDLADEGIAELEAIRNELKPSLDAATFSMFEHDWVDQSLLMSLVEKKDPKAEVLATRIAGRMLVSSSLGS